MRHTTIPGPKGLPLLGSVIDMTRDRLDFYGRLGAYGPISRFFFGRFPVYLLNHPDLIQEVLVSRRDDVWKAPFERQRLSRWLGLGLLTSEGDFHRRQRRLAQPAFHYGRIQSYADTMVRATSAMLEQWHDGEVRDVDRDMSRLTMEIVGLTLFGAQVSDDTAARVTAALEMLQKASLSVVESMLPIPSMIPLPSRVAIRRGKAELDAVIRPIIAARRASGDDRGDLLSMLLLARDEATGEHMNDTQVRDEVVTIFLAGHETTANTLTWAWHLLSRHPEVAARLHDELDTVLGERAPTLADLPRLSFTEMVVKETLRMYPPAWLLAPRQAQVDMQIGGYQLAAGSVFLISPYVSHRNPEFFPEPGRFDPERFSEEREKEIPKYAYVPFGAGAHVCIGNSFAMMEARLLLATIAQCFTLTHIRGQVVKTQPLITLGTRDGLRMRLARREPRALEQITSLAATS
jgi:cytochrome P450